MINILNTYFPDFLTGFLKTLESSIIALIGSLILGTIFAIFEVSQSKIIRRIGEAYVEVFRNIPCTLR